MTAGRFATVTHPDADSTREALRCLKRHIARTVFKTMRRAEAARREEASPTTDLAVSCRKFKFEVQHLRF